MAQSKQDEHRAKPALNADQHFVPNMADMDYIAAFDKKEARIYNAMTTIVSATKDPILVTPRCHDTRLWKLNLDYEVLGHKYPDQLGILKTVPFGTLYPNVP